MLWLFGIHFGAKFQSNNHQLNKLLQMLIKKETLLQLLKALMIELESTRTRMMLLVSTIIYSSIKLYQVTK